MRILSTIPILMLLLSVAPLAHAQQGARNTPTAPGQAAIAGSNGPAAILALPPANGTAQRMESSTTSSNSGTSAKVMPVHRPGTTGR